MSKSQSKSSSKKGIVSWEIIEHLDNGKDRLAFQTLNDDKMNEAYLKLSLEHPEKVYEPVKRIFVT